MLIVEVLPLILKSGGKIPCTKQLRDGHLELKSQQCNKLLDIMLPKHAMFSFSLEFSWY